MAACKPSRPPRGPDRPFRRPRLLVGLLLVLSSPAAAQQPDFGTYAELSQRAVSAHEALAEQGSGDPDLLVRAEAADRAVLDWLEDFMETSVFRDLDRDARRLVRVDRDRVRYNLAGVLHLQGRCAETRTLIDDALTELVDEELGQPLLDLQAQPCDDGQSLAGADDDPTWYEWTLWGGGLVAVGAGVGYLLWASGRDDDLAELEADGFVIENPAHEAEIVDDLRLTGNILLVVGLAAGLTGTLLYLLDDPEPESDATSAWRFGLAPSGAVLELRF